MANNKLRFYALIGAALAIAGLTAACTRNITEGPRKITSVFLCDDNKSVTATFYPDNDAKVDLKLSDGGMFSIPRAISADGARYANPEETFVFWNKGKTAIITENGALSYSNCTAK